MPSFGALQTSQQVLESHRANSIDTATLLIALFRAANIPVRYTVARVQIPVSQMQNWLGGVKTSEAVMSLLSQGGILHTPVVTGGQISHIEMEQTWVDAWIDFYPSRGARLKAGIVGCRLTRV